MIKKNTKRELKLHKKRKSYIHYLNSCLSDTFLLYKINIFRKLIIFLPYLPQVKEAVRGVVMAGWSWTQHVKVIPVFKDCLFGREKTLRRYISRLWLSITWRHFDWRRGSEFTNKSEDSRASLGGCSDRLL